MGALRMLAAYEVRRRWRSIVAATVLVGVVGAVVLASVAGARRTDTALARLTRSSRAASVEVITGSASPAQLRALERVPHVTGVAALQGFFLPLRGAPNSLAAAPVDTAWGRVVDRARIVAGRAADPSAVDEITIGESLAAQLHLGVGDHLDPVSWTPLQVLQLLLGATDAGAPAGPRLQLRIVGVERLPIDLGRQGALGGVLAVTPAFTRAYADRIGSFGTILRVRTANGATDLPRVEQAARRILGPSPQFSVRSTAAESGGVQNAIDVLSLALWILAGVMAVGGVTAIGIVLTREAALIGDDQPTLRALGLTRTQRVVKSGPRALLIAGGGAVIAVAGALAASSLLPIGVARRVEPDPGLHADWAVLALGAAAVFIVVAAIALAAALRSTRALSFDDTAPTRRRAANIPERAARAGLPPTVTNGLRMAFEPGRGSTAVPVRSAFLGAVFGVVGVTAVLVLASSLSHLVATPRLYGWTADFAATTASGNGSCTHDDVGILKTRGVGAVAAVCYGSDNVQLDGHPMNGWTFTSLRGALVPAILAGRAPRTAREVALGSVTLRTLGKHVGDTVDASGPNGTLSYRIVGRAVFPTLGQPQPVAEGATFTSKGFEPLFNKSNYYRYLVVQSAPGTDPAAVERRATRTIPALFQTTEPTVPVEVDRLRQINWFPATIAILLGGLALIAVGHALVTAVRRHRRDLAVLSTLGFSRRQLRATIAWHATTLATVGLVIGLPVGLLVGRLAWQNIADELGVPTTATISTVAVVLTVPAVLALVNLVAYIPARNAARTRPAITLRSD